MNKTDTRPQLGQRCNVKSEAYKSKTWIGHGWSRTAWVSMKSARPNALYIGWRTVYVGKVQSLQADDYGITRVFIRENSLTVWVFVDSERSNPFYAFPEDVEVYHAD